ncbi:hypothetical protein ACOCEA_08690 [Maribacter sp. CXY002]|uniref:hypothetical protein n=1 Tax=Maribacter luteocoastalis TaxID=3407671 RepID=UPI003B6718F1
MRFNLLSILAILLFILWGSSCRKDFEYATSAGNLTFSKDTVFLDTVFSSIGSSTYILKVYNTTRDDIMIPSIQLRNGEESFYRLNVDGVPGKLFKNVPLYAKDSLFIFIETTITTTETDPIAFIYTDAIVFDTDTNQQKVELVTLAKDAIFLYPGKNENGNNKQLILGKDEEGNASIVDSFGLTTEQLNFTNIRPYVIYGYAVIDSSQTLIIDSGTRVHFHQDSGILVNKGGRLIINGNLSENNTLLEKEVIFEGDRLEPSYSDLPGQWGGIWITKGSINNQIEYLTIKNAGTGIYVEGLESLSTPTITIKNSQIYNSANNNIEANDTHIRAENVVLGGAGKSSLHAYNGGIYNFTHCTIANYWNHGFRTQAALKISNSSKFIGENEANDLVVANFKNCIIDGNGLQELSLLDNGENEFDFMFQNCMIKIGENSGQDSPLYAFETNARYSNIFLNSSMDYFRPTKNNFMIGLESEVINSGLLEFAQEVPLDILGKNRTTVPDLGAFQATSREE